MNKGTIIFTGERELGGVIKILKEYAPGVSWEHLDTEDPDCKKGLENVLVKKPRKKIAFVQPLTQEASELLLRVIDINSSEISNVCGIINLFLVTAGNATSPRRCINEDTAIQNLLEEAFFKIRKKRKLFWFKK